MSLPHAPRAAAGQQDSGDVLHLRAIVAAWAPRTCRAAPPVGTTWGSRTPPTAAAALAPEAPARSERALVQSAQRGDPGAIEELYRRHWQRAYRAAYLVTRDAHAAEDIAQEAFLQAIRVLDRFDRARPFAPWLHRIVTNRALDWARAHALRRPVAERARARRARGPQRPLGRPGRGDRPAGARSARGRSCCATCSSTRPGEIADMLDLPRGTVNSRLRRALDELAGDGRGVNVHEQLLTRAPAGLRGPGRDRGGRARPPARARGLRRARARAPPAPARSATRLARAGGAARRRRGRGRRSPARRLAAPGRARRSRRSSSTSGVVLALGRGVAYTVDARGRVRALGPATRRRPLAARR